MAAVRTWSAESLAQRVGDAPCRVFLQDAASRRRSWDRGTDVLDLPFDEYLERMKTEPLYLNNATELVHACPELLDDLELRHLRRFTDPRSSWDELITTTFSSERGTSSPSFTPRSGATSSSTWSGGSAG